MIKFEDFSYHRAGLMDVDIDDILKHRQSSCKNSYMLSAQRALHGTHDTLCSRDSIIMASNSIINHGQTGSSIDRIKMLLSEMNLLPSKSIDTQRLGLAVFPLFVFDLTQKAFCSH